jgi:hypothetical protein
MSFENKSHASSLSDEDIHEAEKVIGDIPNDLLNLYRGQNSGIPSRTLFAAESEDEYLLDYLFPIPEVRLEPASQNIVKVNLALKQQHLIPDDHLVFGSDPGRNYFSIARTDGAIWYHPMDMWEEDRSAQENQVATMEQLSRSLPVFLDALAQN